MNVSIPTGLSPPYSYTFDLEEPAGLQFLASMYDADGFGTGGTTPVLSEFSTLKHFEKELIYQPSDHQTTRHASTRESPPRPIANCLETSYTTLHSPSLPTLPPPNVLPKASPGSPTSLGLSTSTLSSLAERLSRFLFRKKERHTTGKSTLMMGRNTSWPCLILGHTLQVDHHL